MTGILSAGAKVNGVGILADGSAWINGDHGIYSIDLLGNIRLVFDQPVHNFLAFSFLEPMFPTLSNFYPAMSTKSNNPVH
jgi:hypothetical protein